jgi:KDO2-lipid IV(A) lauroyltransferase
VSQKLTGAAYSAAWKLVRVLPEGPVKAAFLGGAGWFAGRGGAGVQQLARNLRRVVGHDPSEAELKRAMQSYARYWYEAFRLPEWDEAEIRRRFTLENAEELDKALAAGKGAVVALPHSANWDLAGAWATQHGFPVTTVAERLKPEDLYERFLNFRRALGMEILPLTGGNRPPLNILTERLQEGRLVVLLADRDLSARGVEVDFFGERTKMPAGPAALALRTGAPLYGLAAWNDGPMTRARLIGPLEVPVAPGTQGRTTGASGGSPGGGGLESGGSPDGVVTAVEEGTALHRTQIAAVTQRVADALAEGIAAHPVDWHMLQPLWLADLPARRRKTT